MAKRTQPRPEPRPGRQFPVLRKRLRWINFGMFAVLTALKFLVEKDHLINNKSLRTAALESVHPMPDLLSVSDAIHMLVEDAVLVDKEKDGRWRLDLSMLEKRIEIYGG